MDIEIVRLYRREVLAGPSSPPRPRPEAAVSGFRFPPPPPAPCFDPPEPSFPKPIVFPTRRLNEICAGPRAKLRVRSCSPAVGFGSSNPYDVAINPGLLGSVAIPGRELNSVVPYRSLPDVISNGIPVCVTTNGLIRIFQRRFIEPP